MSHGLESFLSHYKRRVIFTVIFFLFAFLMIVYQEYLLQKERILTHVDSTLLRSAQTIPFVLENSFFEDVSTTKGITQAQDEQNILSLSHLATTHHVKYLYVLKKKGEKVYFVASSATEHELATKEKLTHFGDEYTTISPTLKKAFESQRVTFDEYHDDWGHFRSIAIPLTQRNGETFLLAADIEITSIQDDIFTLALKEVTLSFLLLSALIPLVWVYTNWVKDVKKELTRQVTKATTELTELNATLEERIRVEVEKNSQQERVMLQQSRHAAMGEMIASIAHQWRQPLNAIGLILIHLKLDIDEKGSVNTPQCLTVIENLQAKVLFLSQTIDSFREFFKPEKEKSHTFFEDVLLKSYAIVQESLLEKKITVTLPPEVTLPLVEGKCYPIFCYANELSQVIINILNNAKDVCLERKIENPHITLSFHQDEKSISLLIKDNAGGIPEEIISKIFDPYFSTKDQKNGTGIGLYMSKTIVENHHQGMITAQNCDEGACFTITLPM